MFSKAKLYSKRKKKKGLNEKNLNAEVLLSVGRGGGGFFKEEDLHQPRMGFGI